MTARTKRPRDPVQLAKLVGDIATGQVNDQGANDGKNPAAVMLGRLGGLKGGARRAAILTPEQRSEISRRAAAVRWSAKTKKKT
jgi:hypothetical protein